MTAHAQHATVLEACLGKAARLETFIGYAPDSIVSKTILDKPSRIVAMSFCEPRSCIGRLSS